MNFRTTLASALRSTPTARTEQLRVTIDTIRTSKRLDGLADTLADVLERYDTHSVDPALRADIQELLAGGVEITQIMLNPAFSVDEALTLIATQQRILANVLRYLAQRPQKIGYSILSCKNNTLLGHFGTKQEAEAQLAMLQAAGHCPNSLVVPVKITSQFAQRPEASEGTTHLGEPTAIPNGIKPEPSLEPLQPFEPMPAHVKTDKEVLF